MADLTRDPHGRSRAQLLHLVPRPAPVAPVGRSRGSGRLVDAEDAHIVEAGWGRRPSASSSGAMLRQPVRQVVLKAPATSGLIRFSPVRLAAQNDRSTLAHRPKSDHSVFTTSPHRCRKSRLGQWFRNTPLTIGQVLFSSVANGGTAHANGT